MKLNLKDNDTSINLNEVVFNYEYNEGLIHQIIVAQLNNLRSGNSAQKTRAEVRGGGKKPWRQKGTGRARAGTIRSPIWRSGGVTFASKKRDYSQKVNKKMYKRALRSIFSELYRLNKIHVVSQFECETHKTKEFLTKMNSMQIDNALIILNNFNENTYLACRNLIEFDICEASEIDPVSLIKYNSILVTQEALEKIEEQLL